MSAKIIVLCAQALLIQSALSQCINRAGIDASAAYGWAAPGLAPVLGYDAFGYDGLGCGGRGLAYEGYYPGMDFTPTSGGGLPVTSVSPISPIGISVISENTYEGPLMVAGELPFVAVVALDGVLPSAGSGAINHACGNGVSAMISEGIAPASAAYGAYGSGYAPAAGLGYGYGGYGCGLY